MDKAQMHEIMQISRNFEKVNKAARIASNALAELRSIGSHFITDEQNKILRAADGIMDELRETSNEWNAAKYAVKTIEETNN